MTQKMYFLAFDKNGNADLWVTDGTTTTAVGGLGDVGVSGAGTGGLGAEYLEVFGQKMIFSGQDGLNDAENNGIWLTDGTAGGTTEVGGVSPGPGKPSPFIGGDPSGLMPVNFLTFGTKALFFGLDGGSFPGLWSTDGTPSGTIELGGLSNGQIALRGTNWDPRNIAAFGNSAIFNAYDSSNGGASYKGLWITDGTTAGTLEIGGLQNAAIGDSNAGSFEAINDLNLGGFELFNAENKAGDESLWITDGTAQGTVEIGGASNQGVVGANNTGLGVGFANAVQFGARVFFNGEDASDAKALWTTDGTALGTQEVGGLGNAGLTAYGQHPSSQGLDPTNLTVNGQKVLFNGQDAVSFSELWVSDGTALGTYEIGGEGVGGTLANEAVNGVNPQSIVSLGNGKAVFIGDDSSNHQNSGKPTLWVTDGTYAGTSEIGGLDNQGVSGVYNQGLNIAGDDIVGGSGLAYFVGQDSAGNDVLWKTDGTQGGTRIVNATDGNAPALGVSPTPASMTMSAVPAAVDAISGGGESVNLNNIPGETVDLSGTNGVYDTVTGSNGIVNLSTAQAYLIGGGLAVTLTGLCAVGLYNTLGNKDSVFGSKGTVTLNNAQANVVGLKNTIDFANGTTGNVVYLSNTDAVWDTVNGSNGSIYLTSAQASVVGGGDKMYFAGGSDDQVSLYSTNGNWDTVYGAAGSITVNASQVSVVGGGDFITATAGSTVSLYNTNGNWDTVNATNAQIILNGAQASVVGGGNKITATAGSTASLYGTSGNWDTVFGSSLSLILNGAEASIVGGDDAINATSGSQLSLYATSGHWDTVTATGTKVVFNGAQASIVGGNDSIFLLGGAADLASLYGTNGNQDTVTASNAYMILNDVQASIVGGGDVVTATASSAASLYNTNGGFDTVNATSALTILNGAQASVVGGNNTITETAGSTASLYSTHGAWDQVNANSAYVLLNGAEASVVGVSNQIAATAGSSMSLYNTGTHADNVSGSGVSLVLNGSEAALSGNADTVSFSGSSALSASGSGDNFYFGQAFGTSWISGLATNDVIHLSALDWTSFQALNASGDLTLLNGNAVIQLGANNLTLVGVQPSTLTSTQFVFA